MAYCVFIGLVGLLRGFTLVGSLLCDWFVRRHYRFPEMLIIPLVTKQEGGFHRFRKKLGIVVHKLRKSHKLNAFRDILGTEMRTR